MLSCRTNYIIKDKECDDVISTLYIFKDKMIPLKSGCYNFKFDIDSLKYIDYRFINGKEHFMDYRLNEIIFFQNLLTNEYLNLNESDRNCLRKLTKEDIIFLLGKPTKNNDHYNSFTYVFNFTEDCPLCVQNGSNAEDCTQALNIKFNKGYVDKILINVFSL